MSEDPKSEEEAVLILDLADGYASVTGVEEGFREWWEAGRDGFPVLVSAEGANFQVCIDCLHLRSSTWKV